MPARSAVQSPVLVGRADLINLAERRLAEAAGGTGQMLFLAGEAGIGKTHLLGAITQQAKTQGFAVVRAAAYPGDSQSFAGLLLDLASDLRAAQEPALRELGDQLAARVRSSPAATATTATTGDAHHRRRVLVQDLVDLFMTTDTGVPVLVVLEDLHWADQLSLDVVGHLAARLRAKKVLVAGAYRSDELYPQVAMRDVRSRLLSQRLAEEVRLPRLDADETAALTQARLGRQLPAQVAKAIHERSDGIPLHIEELLAAVNNDALMSRFGATVLTVEVPDTLGDAILSRVAMLAASTREVATAAAVIGRSFDFDLLTEIAGADPIPVARALRDLREAHLVVVGSDATTFDFRHALIRDALYADTDLPVRRHLHERVARAAAERGLRDAFVSAHFEQARCPDLAYAHAVAAAREAVAISAHGDALELCRRAVRNAPATLPSLDRAELFAALADEAAAADDNQAAADAYRTAHQLAVEAGAIRAAAALVPRLVDVRHLLGDGLDARVDVLEAALDTLDDVPDADTERARLRSALAAAYMLDRCVDEAIAFGERSRAESQLIGDEQANLNTTATVGSVLVFAGRSDEGWPLLEGAVTRARDTSQEAEAARAYRMVGSSASVLVEYDRAERWLPEGIGYAAEVELWNHRHYMAAHLAHVQWATGQWDAAAATAQQALLDGRGGITTRITAQYVLGYLAVGRGDWATAENLLQAAYADGTRMDELQRLSPPLWGLAEAALAQGDAATAVTRCERGYQASVELTDAAYLFPFLVTGARAHLALGSVDAADQWVERVGAALTEYAIPGTLPALDHGRGLLLLARGDLPEARLRLESAGDAWRSRRRFWEGTAALLDLAAVAARSRRQAEASKLVDQARTSAATAGATTLVAAADRLVATFGGGRPMEPWYPLSAREFEVAQLVATGLTNRQIAERLTLAPKTISAHVEHILTKLGAARRTEIAAWCATVRSEPSPTHPVGSGTRA